MKNLHRDKELGTGLNELRGGAGIRERELKLVRKSDINHNVNFPIGNIKFQLKLLKTWALMS